jgi:hypothetical protein
MNTWKYGDIVLFQSYGNSWYDKQTTKLVQEATHGPYVHVAIICATDGTSKAQIIQANNQGISYEDIDAKTKCTVVSLRDFANNPPLTEQRIKYALDGVVLLQKNHTPYSWLDIVDQGIRLLPRSIPWWTVKQANRFDCSNLAMWFLSSAGVLIPYGFDYPYDVSPNDIAEFLGLLPLRRQVWK